ncbi:RWP-RK domain-containing protein [Psidium guajava]|nr:RWP-RK domain-containing protein [Psidium guajava]
MADPKAAVPGSDSDNDLYGDDYLDYLLLDPNPSLEDDLPPLDLQLAVKSDEKTPLPGNGISDLDPFDDPAVWHMFSGQHGNGDNGAGSSLAGPSGTSNGGAVDCYSPQPEDWNYFVPRLLADWPVPPLPYNCSCCHVLREIIHTHVETNHTTKLELHGRVGIVSHAILDTQHNPGVIQSDGDHRYQMFDFCKKSIQNVKDFLQQYCEGRRLAGYIMYQDPLAMFYEAVCVGIDFNGNVNADYFFQQPPTLTPTRERAGKMTLADVGGYFHLPIEKASKRLRLCPTVVKKICRKGGVGRWPYRKVQCMEKKILDLRERLKGEDEPKRSCTQAEIQEWQRKLDKIRYGVARTE